MEANLDDKVAVITGIGFETPRRPGRMGIAVVLGRLEGGREATEKLRAEGIKDVEAFRLDIVVRRTATRSPGIWSTATAGSTSRSTTRVSCRRWRA